MADRKFEPGEVVHIRGKLEQTLAAVVISRTDMDVKGQDYDCYTLDLVEDPMQRRLLRTTEILEVEEG